ncbi:MAG TPA: methionyl-tRNA formyltransferase [Bacteroidia bacterium]|nr:methionyl-tRNA formyltransferase [Bacteroidia bacterium]
MKIIYFGTPAFAVEPLRVLLENNFSIAAVVTAADKPSGRGLKVTASDVKQFALSKNLPVLQPEKLSDENFLAQLKLFNADLFIVVAFRKLPDVVWKMPQLGTINLHASLLPDYRGAAPINHAVINGESETGVTTFFINDKIDTGKIILQKKISITENETAGELYHALMLEGAQLLLKTVKQISEGKVNTMEQNKLTAGNRLLHTAPKLTREFCRINWNNSCENIFNLIRGLSPYPAAWTEFHPGDSVSRVSIFKSQKEISHHDLKPGTFESDNKTFLKIAVPDGFIHLLELQMSGKKKLSVEEFLRGFKTNNCSAR